MIKKLIALGVTALFSLNASAAYSRYDFKSNDVSGFFVQNQDDLSIAYYDFYSEPNPAATHFEPSGIFSNITWAMAGQNNTGPSSFEVYNGATEVYYTQMWLGFTRTNTPGTYVFNAYFKANRDSGYPTDPWVDPLVPVSRHYTGTIMESALDANFSAFIDSYREFGIYPGGLSYLVPGPNVQVPEPASIALLALGITGLAATRRRKQGK